MLKIFNIIKLKRKYIKETNKLEKYYGSRINNSTGQEKDELIGMFFCEKDEIDAFYNIEMSNHLTNKAKRLGVPLPKEDDSFWSDHEQYPYKIILSLKGRHKLTKDIRNEKKERREPFISWTMMIIGIIGGITGLISIINSFIHDITK